MSPPDAKLHAFTQDQLEDAASRGVEVMVPVHTHTFEPWGAESLTRCVSRLVALTRADPGGVRAAVRADAELDRFCNDHWMLGEKLMTPAFVRDDNAVRSVTQLILLRAQMDDGRLTAPEAQSRVSSVVMDGILSAKQEADAAAAGAGASTSSG